MDAKWIAVIAALIGFVSGITIQQMTTIRSIHMESLDNINTLRSQTYVDFLKAMAKYQEVRSHGVEESEDIIKRYPDDTELSSRLQKTLREAKAETKEARLRLAIFAPDDVVRRLASYYRDHFHQERCRMSLKRWEADVQTSLAMRKSLLAGVETDSVDPDDLYLLMWNCTRPDQSQN